MPFRLTAQITNPGAPYELPADFRERMKEYKERRLRGESVTNPEKFLSETLGIDMVIVSETERVKQSIIDAVRVELNGTDPAHVRRICRHVEMVLVELFENHLDHGIEWNPNKRITVDATVAERQLTLVTEDSGSGFDVVAHIRSAVSRMLGGEAGEGEGVGIIQFMGLSTSARWGNGGRKVELIKNLLETDDDARTVLDFMDMPDEAFLLPEET